MILHPQKNQKLTLVKMGGPEYDPSYYEEEKEVPSPLARLLRVAVLTLEMGIAIISFLQFTGFAECCNDYFFADTEKEKEMWDEIFAWTSIGYFALATLCIPLVWRGWHVSTFIHVVGFLLAGLTLYNTHTVEAMVMLGLEVAAVFLQTYVLCRDGAYPLLLFHSLNYAVMGVAVYGYVLLLRQGGYCIVGGKLETIFEESTCQMDCDNLETSCSVCGIEPKSCFIKF